MRGNLNTNISMRVQGDVYTAWKSLSEVLGSYNPKITITLNLHNRRARKVSHAFLEVLVEAKSTHVDWKLKLNGVSITREFKPPIALELPEQGKYIYKFIYDVTSLLNIDEVISREWANVTIKHEGGEPLGVRGILLNVIYEDNEAISTYNHLTGLLLLEQNEEYTYRLNPQPPLTSSEGFAKFILYAPRACRVKIISENTIESLTIPHPQVEEHTIPLHNNASYIKVISEQEQGIPGYLVLSSITLYSTHIKAPNLNIVDVEVFKEDSRAKIKLKLLNMGDSKPDRVVISIFNRGILQCMFREDGFEYELNKLIERELVAPMPQKPSELVIRVAWSKLTKTWFIDRKISF